MNNQIINLSDYGLDPAILPESADGISARVTAVHKERYGIVCEQGHTFARLKSAAYFADDEADFPTVGDFVLIRHNPLGDSVILQTLPRRTFFSRRSKDKAGNAEQAVAANFDYVFIITSLNQNFNTKRLERYLALAWQSGALPVILLSKADLCDDYADQLGQAQAAAIGVDVLPVSAYTGQGMDILSGYFTPGKTGVFLGSSGVGKSSLVNALAGEQIMGVSAIREDDARGRHTTTHRELVMLPSGGMIIDTPGMRELGMWDVTTGLGGAFADITALFGGCKFADCRHISEPGCAVRAAIADGTLPAERWESYLKLGREAHYSDGKAAYLRARTAHRKQINIVNPREKTSKRSGKKL